MKSRISDFRLVRAIHILLMLSLLLAVPFPGCSSRGHVTLIPMSSNDCYTRVPEKCTPGEACLKYYEGISPEFCGEDRSLNGSHEGIGVGEHFTIIINRAYIGLYNREFFTRPNNLMWYPDTAEVAVVLTIDDGTGDEPKNVFVGYYEQVGLKQDLPFDNLLAYSTASWNGQPIRIKLSVIEMDEFGESFTKYLGQVSAVVQKSVSPAYSPGVKALESIGTFLIARAAEDDIVVEFEFQVYPMRNKSDPNSGETDHYSFSHFSIPALREAQFALLRAETKSAFYEDYRSHQKEILFGRRGDLYLLSQGDCATLWIFKDSDCSYYGFVKHVKPDPASTETERKQLELDKKGTLRPLLDDSYLVVTVTQSTDAMPGSVAFSFSRHVEKVTRDRAAEARNLPDLDIEGITAGIRFYHASEVLANFQKNTHDMETMLNTVKYYEESYSELTENLKGRFEAAFLSYVPCLSSVPKTDENSPRELTNHLVSKIRDGSLKNKNASDPSKKGEWSCSAR